MSLVAVLFSRHELECVAEALEGRIPKPRGMLQRAWRSFQGIPGYALMQELSVHSTMYSLGMSPVPVYF